MGVRRAAGLIVTSLGTCTFILLMDIVEIFRHFQGTTASYVRILTSFPIMLYMLASIAWIVVGIVLMLPKKGRQDGA